MKFVWVWAKGGGWNGPSLRSDVWLDANNYALSHLVWDTKASGRTLALQWATLRFGPASAEHLVRVLDLSDEIVLRSIYVGPFAKNQGPWAPNVAWTRDDVVFGGDRVGAMYERSKTGAEFDEAINEKDTANRLIQELGREMQLAADKSANLVLAEQAINTARYGDSLLTALNNYVTGMYYYYRWRDTGKNDLAVRTQAVNRLNAWEANWQVYINQTLGLPWVATGYIDNGMLQTIADAREDMNRSGVSSVTNR